MTGVTFIPSSFTTASARSVSSILLAAGAGAGVAAGAASSPPAAPTSAASGFFASSAPSRSGDGPSPSPSPAPAASGSASPPSATPSSAQAWSRACTIGIDAMRPSSPLMTSTVSYSVASVSSASMPLCRMRFVSAASRAASCMLKLTVLFFVMSSACSAWFSCSATTSARAPVSVKALRRRLTSVIDACLRSSSPSDAAPGSPMPLCSSCSRVIELLPPSTLTTAPAPLSRSRFRERSRCTIDDADHEDSGSRSDSTCRPFRPRSVRTTSPPPALAATSTAACMSASGIEGYGAALLVAAAAAASSSSSLSSYSPGLRDMVGGQQKWEGAGTVLVQFCVWGLCGQPLRVPAVTEAHPRFLHLHRVHQTGAHAKL